MRTGKIYAGIMISKISITESDLEQIAKTIDPRARRSGRGWSLKCPVHDDKNPSLSIGIGEAEHLIVNCFAGCDALAVLQEIERRVGHLLPEVRSGPHKKKGVVGCASKARPRIVAKYDYRDENGDIVATKYRTDPKDFHWDLRQKEGIIPIFDLPEVLMNAQVNSPDAQQSFPLFIVEGEKDCRSLSKLSYVVTTSPHGASGTIHPEYVDWIGNQDVVLIPDRDEPGLKYAKRWYESGRGTFKSTRILWLPARFNGRPVKDVSDLLNCEGGKQEFERLLVIAPHCDQAIFDRLMAEIGVSSSTASPIRFEKFKALPRPIEWYWEPYLPKGAFCLLAGRPGCGKSAIVADLCARLSRGGKLPDGKECQPTKILLIELEDSENVTASRLIAAGYDPEKVLTIRMTANDEELGCLRFDDDLLRELRDRIVAESFEVVVISPLIESVAVTDENSAAEVRNALRPLANLARSTNITVLGIVHTRKGTTDIAQFRIAGSHAFSGVARHILGVFDHPEKQNSRVFGAIKTNLGVLSPAIPFEIIDASIAGENGSLVRTCIIRWDIALTITVDEVLAADGDGPNEPPEIESWLGDLLEAAGGKMRVSEVETLFSEAYRLDLSALRRAKRKLGIESVREAGCWFYILPSVQG